jgi:hypothetical protein
VPRRTSAATSSAPPPRIARSTTPSRVARTIADIVFVRVIATVLRPAALECSPSVPMSPP